MSDERASNAIEIEDMTHRYGRRPAVEGLTLKVPEGSVHGLLGENGAGKTTTIQAMLGLIRPTSGRLRVLGLDPTRDGLGVRRCVGYVPEQPVFYDWMTVEEIGWFASGFHPEDRDRGHRYQARYRELAAGFELVPGRKIKQLSKGMRAKVALSLALASDPRLLILDEPTSGLDIQVRREFLESMVDRAAEGRTVLLSSHQIAEVERVASHVSLIHQGRLVLNASLEELRQEVRVLTMESPQVGAVESMLSGQRVEVVDEERFDRQIRWLARSGDPRAWEQLRGQSMGGVEMRPASLEEIYLGVVKARKPRVAAGGRESAVVVGVA